MLHRAWLPHLQEADPGRVKTTVWQIGYCVSNVIGVIDMRYKFSKDLACLALALAGIAGQASAQTIAAGPYYASPSWDQTMACCDSSQLSALHCSFQYEQQGGS